MTIQTALAFFELVRASPDLQAEMAAWGPHATTQALLDLARSSGHAFTEPELQAAFRHDWVMRWLRDSHHVAAAQDGRSGTELQPPQ